MDRIRRLRGAISLNNYNFANHGKLLVMLLFLLMDLGLNGTLDYDILNDRRQQYDILLGILALQLVTQIFVFLLLVLTAAETYLFRVGLTAILLNTVRTVLIMHALYIISTIAAGAYRVQRLSGSDTLSSLWKDDSFIFLSTIQKIGKCWQQCLFQLCWFISDDISNLWSTVYCGILNAVAIPYYIFNIRTAIKLEDPIYYHKDHWIALIKQVEPRSIRYPRDSFLLKLTNTFNHYSMRFYISIATTAARCGCADRRPVAASATRSSIPQHLFDLIIV